MFRRDPTLPLGSATYQLRYDALGRCVQRTLGSATRVRQAWRRLGSYSDRYVSGELLLQMIS